MLLARQVMMEVVRALVVLALFMLSFGHQPLAREFAPTAYLAGADIAAVTATLFCGDGPGSDEHAPCHACRLGAGAALPMPPAIGLPAFADTAPVCYRVGFQTIVPAHHPGPDMQTGPPQT